MTRLKPAFALLIVVTMLALAQLACIAPQDCELISKTIAGRIVAADGSPIEGATVSIGNQVKDEPGFEDGKVDRTLSTDANGRFTTSVSVFRCDMLRLSVSHNGFVGQNEVYSADVGLRESMPTEILITLAKAQ